jgi:hypothetical protein
VAVAVKNAEEQLRVIRAQAVELRETWSKLNLKADRQQARIARRHHGRSQA